jgi:hypothetical protein
LPVPIPVPNLLVIVVLIVSSTARRFANYCPTVFSFSAPVVVLVPTPVPKILITSGKVFDGFCPSSMLSKRASRFAATPVI